MRLKKCSHEKSILEHPLFDVAFKPCVPTHKSVHFKKAYDILKKARSE